MKTLQTLRKLIWSLLLPSGLLLVASLALYALTGKTEFSPELSGRVLGLGCACIGLEGCAIAVAALLHDEGKLIARLLDVIIYAAYALGLLTWLFYLVNEVNYITNILVAIDGTKISFVFLATALGFACAWVLALVCAMRCSKVLKRLRKRSGKEAQKHEKTIAKDAFRPLCDPSVYPDSCL